MSIKTLVIEDEAIIRKIYRSFLTDEDFELYMASTGEKGIKILEGNTDFELVLLDPGLPDIDGFTILERIQEKMPDLPVIMISGFELAEKIYQLTKPNQVYFLKKPFTLQVLYNTIHKALGDRYI